MIMTSNDLMATAALFKVLADQTRLRIIDLLKEEELCVCDISDALDISQSLTSHQLKKLRDQGIVSRRKEKQTIYYKIKDKHILDIYLNALTHIKECN